MSFSCLSSAALRGLLLGCVTLAACAPVAPPSPTTAPKPAEAAKPPAPAASPGASPGASPAASPSPASKPADAGAAAAAAKPGFDEQAVANFYRGKNVRILVGYDPGGLYDTYSRLAARHLSRFIPGNPTIVVENRPGAGSRIAASSVYSAEPKDGTVIASIAPTLATEQIVDPSSIQFDMAKFQWLASSSKSAGGCAVRTDSGIGSVQEIMEGGREIITAADAPGSTLYDIGAYFNAALGTRFKIVTGYTGYSRVALAVQNKEADAFCAADPLAGTVTPMVSGQNPITKFIIILGNEPINHPVLNGVPPAETLAKTPEAKQLLAFGHAPQQTATPWAVAPEVPAERVAALRKAFADTFADAQFMADANAAQMPVAFGRGEDVAKTIQDMLSAPPAVVNKIKELRKL